ncbi:nuclease-related domain-containing protein [Neobacillus rhizophilus]|uniref:NERD domain-containing protein n=1 Tax=Neobacillus rhizophilus TaxID=2833579 RepID=A0A942U772_9BACI|nr:nuclease-related domain-containing protein [Neobacillus rhizophilus]MBS4214670.1 NERD domain-containing protein [Neobacillus rhizophilus]
MILKVRVVPLIILILEAILRRLPKSHPRYPMIEDEHRRRLIGYKGEESLDFYYRSLPEQKYFILHDLNLPDGPYNCQIDTLLISSDSIIAVGSKNIGGNLTFDTENKQFIQEWHGEIKGYPNPIAQEERHQEYLQKLLAAHNFPPVPVDYVVVLSNPYATYVVTGPESGKVKKRICKADAFLNRIKMFEGFYKTPVLDTKDMRRLSRLLIKMNTPPTNFVLEKFGIQKSDLISGALCPTFHHPLIRKKRKWYCPTCQTYSKDAHINMLMDYFLLYDLKITNKQFREFARLDCIHTAGRILRSLNLISSGAKKTRTYSPASFPWDPKKEVKNMSKKVRSGN